MLPASCSCTINIIQITKELKNQQLRKKEEANERKDKNIFDRFDGKMLYFYLNDYEIFSWLYKELGINSYNHNQDIKSLMNNWLVTILNSFLDEGIMKLLIRYGKLLIFFHLQSIQQRIGIGIGMELQSFQF